MTLRRAVLAALLVLAGCQAVPPAAQAPIAQSPAVQSPAAQAAAGGACSGTSGSLLVTERGIGGTGIGQALSERGIGGTGAPSLGPVVIRGLLDERGGGGTGAPTAGTLAGGAPPAETPTDRALLAERGTGGTGIIGEVSLLPAPCVGGVPVALDQPFRITEDGAPRTSETLLPGEIVAIEATGDDTDSASGLRAVSIAVHHEIAGPVTEIAAAGGAIVVAGQRVLLSPATRLAQAPKVGDWVVVSGLRDASGAVHASRVDPRAPGQVMLAGVPVESAGAWWIAGMKLQLPPKLAPDGERLVVGGGIVDGTLRVDQVSPDPPVPADRAIRRIVVEGFPVIAGDHVSLDDGVRAAVGPGFSGTPPANRPVILELESTPAGALLAISWHEASAAPAPAPAALSLRLAAPAGRPGVGAGAGVAR